MANSILTQVTKRGWTVVVEVPDAMERRRLFNVATKAAANPRSVLRLWRQIVLKTLRSRFVAQTGRGGKPWAAHGPGTIELRDLRDLLRISPPEFGGHPARILRSARDEYFKAWTSISKGGPHRPIDDIKSGGGDNSWTIGVNHIAVINEYPRRTKGAIPDRFVPARPLAWIRGDKKLLDKLVGVFAKFIEKRLKQASSE